MLMMTGDSQNLLRRFSYFHYNYTNEYDEPLKAVPFHYRRIHVGMSNLSCLTGGCQGTFKRRKKPLTPFPIYRPLRRLPPQPFDVSIGYGPDSLFLVPK